MAFNVVANIYDVDIFHLKNIYNKLQIKQKYLIIFTFATGKSLVLLKRGHFNLIFYGKLVLNPCYFHIYNYIYTKGIEFENKQRNSI